MRGYADLFVHRRSLVLVFVLALTAASALGLARLRFDDRPRGIFQSEDEEFARLELFFEEFGSDDNDAIVVLEAADWFRPETAELLGDLEERASELPGVESVTSMAGVVLFDHGLLPRRLLPGGDAPAEAYGKAREEARDHPLVRGHLLSEDGRTTLVLIRLGGNDLTIGELQPAVERLDSLVESVDGVHGVRARLTGIPPFRVEIYETIQREQVRFFLVGAVVCLVVAWLLLRNVRAVLVTVLPPVVGTAWVLGSIGLVGVKVDLMSTVLPMLCVLIGVTDSVHLTIDMRREREAGASPLEAARHAIRFLGLPCALTSLTTAVGFGSLALADAPTIQRFGLLCAGGVVLVFLAVVTVLPLAASVVADLGPPGPRKGEGEGRTARLSLALLDALMARPRLVSALSVVLVASLLLTCTRLVPENKLTEATPRGNETFLALQHCEEAFGGILPIYAQLEWPPELGVDAPEVLGALRGAEALFAAEESMSRPLSILDIVEALPGSGDGRVALVAGLPGDPAAGLLREDLGKAVVVARVPDLGSEVMKPMMARLKEGLAEVEANHPGIRARLTGTDVVARESLDEIILSLATGLGFAALIIFGVIAVEFRSLRLGLLSLVPNVFPLALVGALLVALGQPLQISSAIVFTLLLGLAVDDTIHFLVRYRQERRAGSDVDTALRTSFLHVGAAILTTTLILGAGFLVVLTSVVPSNVLVARLLILGLGGALVGDLVILPSLLATWRR